MSGFRSNAARLARSLPCAVSAVLVLHGLGRRSIWLDEGTTIAVARQHGGTLWHWVFHDGGNMVAYYGLMHIVASVFGTATLTVRLASAIATVAAVAVAQLLARDLFGSRAEIPCGLAVATSPPLVYWGQEARGYSLALFFTFAAALLLVRSVRGGGALAWCGLVIASVLAVYTILLSVVALIGLAVSLVVLPPGRTPWRRLGAAAAAGAAFCAPVAVWAVVHGSGQLEWLPPVTGAEVGYVASFMASARVAGAPAGAAAYALDAAAVAAGLATAALLTRRLLRHGRSWEAWGPALLLGGAAVPVVAIAGVSLVGPPMVIDRYFLDTVGFGALMLGLILSRLSPWLAIVVVGAVVLALRGFELAPTYSRSLEDWSGAARYVLASTAPDDCIAFFESDGYPAFDHYVGPEAAGPLPRIVLPDVGWSSDTPFVLDPATIPAQQLGAVTGGCPRLWLITTHVGVPGGADAPRFDQKRWVTYMTLVQGLTHHYRGVTTRDFVGVEVQLFSR